MFRNKVFSILYHLLLAKLHILDNGCSFLIPLFRRGKPDHFSSDVLLKRIFPLDFCLTVSQDMYFATKLHKEVICHIVNI